MLRLSRRFSLRSLLVAIAAIAVALGAGHWGLARLELLRMAAAHRARADRLSIVTAAYDHLVLLSHSGFTFLEDDFAVRPPPARSFQTRRVSLTRAAANDRRAVEAEAAETLRRLLRAIGSAEDDRREEAASQLRSMTQQLDRQIRVGELLRRRQTWHKARARRLRGPFAYNVRRERAVDQRQEALFDKEQREIESDALRADIAEHQAAASRSEARARALSGSLASLPIVERLFTRFRIYQHNQRARRHRAQADAAQKTLLKKDHP